MMQFFLEHMKPNLTKEEVKKNFGEISLGTDEIIQDIYAIDENGRRVSILKIGEQNQVSFALGKILMFTLSTIFLLTFARGLPYLQTPRRSGKN